MGKISALQKRLKIFLVSLGSCLGMNSANLKKGPVARMVYSTFLSIFPDMGILSQDPFEIEEV